MATPNRIIERYHNGEKAIGIQMSFVSEVVIEVAAKMGMDFYFFGWAARRIDVADY